MRHPARQTAWVICDHTIYHYCRLWRLAGVWAKGPATLREAGRIKAGRELQPSAGMLERQSVNTTGVGGIRGAEGAKTLRGRKRHLLVDTQGLVVRATVHSAAIQDRAAVPLVLNGAAAEVPGLQHVWVDQGYTGSGTAWIEANLGWDVEVVGPPPKPCGVWAPIGAVSDWEALRPKGFRGVLPRRRVIEMGQPQCCGTSFSGDGLAPSDVSSLERLLLPSC